MDSYLEIAEKVIDIVKEPMRPKQILEFAYLNDLMPTSLYGRTQHKTLQARISEDILHKGDKSLFYRTSPGVFFLTKFLDDPNISKSHKQVYISRRRERDLRRKPVLILNNKAINSAFKTNKFGSIDKIKKHLSFENIKYEAYDKAIKERCSIIWSFVIVYRHNEVLSYRQGRYRENRDAFMNRQTIGFPYLVSHEDSTLFEQNDFGIKQSGFEKVALDLGMPIDQFDSNEINSRLNLEEFVLIEDTKSSDLLSIVTFKCPKWFEPTTNKLAINNLRWLDLQKNINNIDDFDPWSQNIFERIRFTLMSKAA